MPVILTTQEAEIREREIVGESLSQKILHKKRRVGGEGWWSVSR
jgi:hypothetical protein